jgi:hypothetical protein
MEIKFELCINKHDCALKIEYKSTKTMLRRVSVYSILYDHGATQPSHKTVPFMCIYCIEHYMYL